MIYQFAYSDYTRFVWENAFILVRDLWFPILAFASVFVRYRKEKDLPDRDLHFRGGLVMACLATMMLVFWSGLAFFTSGISMLFDINAQSICVEGEITEVDGSSTFCVLNGDICDYYIEDASYSSIRVPDVTVGTPVKISYLPNSKLVLSIEILD